MALTRESIRTILAEHGYRAVFDDSASRGDVRSGARYAEARSPRIEVLQREYGAEPDRVRGTRSAAPEPAEPEPRYRGTGAIVIAEPLHGRGRRKAIVLSEDGEILGEQG